MLNTVNGGMTGRTVTYQPKNVKPIWTCSALSLMFSREGCLKVADQVGWANRDCHEMDISPSKESHWSLFKRGNILVEGSPNFWDTSRFVQPSSFHLHRFFLGSGRLHQDAIATLTCWGPSDKKCEEVQSSNLNSESNSNHIYLWYRYILRIYSSYKYKNIHRKNMTCIHTHDISNCISYLFFVSKFFRISKL